MPPSKLGLSFYSRGTVEVARDLIGKVLVRRAGGMEYRARIVEAEAYLGPKDLASHASKGRTGRTEALFGPPGHAYVYLIYGMHWMLNAVTGAAGGGEAVLVRAAEPLGGWEANLSGPGRLARAMEITRAENGLILTGPGLHVADDGRPRPRIAAASRVGVEYAKQWKDAPLRFFDADSPAVSRPRPQTG